MWEICFGKPPLVELACQVALVLLHYHRFSCLIPANNTIEFPWLNEYSLLARSRYLAPLGRPAWAYICEVTTLCVWRAGY